MNIGKRVRQVREDLGMSQAELARRAGVARNHIVMIEAGGRTPSVGLLEKIARELRTEPAELLREPVPLAEAPEAGRPDPRVWGWDEDRPDPTKMRPGPRGRAISRSEHDEVAVEDEVQVRVEKALRILRAFDAGAISADVTDKELAELYKVA